MKPELKEKPRNCIVAQKGIALQKCKQPKEEGDKKMGNDLNVKTSS